MKNKVILSLIAVFLFVGAGVFAQGTQKFAHANSDSIVVSLPEFKTQQKILESYGKQLQATLQDKEKALQAKYEEYQTQVNDWIPDVRAEKEKEINQLSQGLQEFRQTASQKLQAKEQEVYAPLFEKVQKGIEDVAKENGYTYVLPTAVFLFAAESDDITNLVIKKLGGTVGG